MKNLLLTAIIVVSMSLASFANNANAIQFNKNGGNVECIDNAGPHTKQYEDMKKILDEFEQAIKEMKSCEDLDNAELAMLFQILALTENNYDEDMTAEEGQEIQEQMNRIDVETKKMQMQLGCESEGEGGQEE